MYSTRSNSRNSAPQAKRYNVPATFVQNTQTLQSTLPQQQQNMSAVSQVWPQPTPAIPPLMQQSTAPIKMSTSPEPDQSAADNSYEPKKWMKKGYKLSMREKRRRQNKTLRRLITPKNALMVLNELSAGAQQECQVMSDGDDCGSNQVNRQYVAVLNMGGVQYSGKGSTKLMAKNQAAESVIRDLMIKQMNQAPPPDSTNGNNDAVDDEKDESSFPMIQLASYALHKLFTEWQTEGYKVPSFGQGKGEQPPAGHMGTGPSPTKPKKVPALPTNPETLHPCTLLSQMRGNLEYVMLSQEGTPPNGQIFTMGVTVEGRTYAGRASNKKEARKQAAAQACTDLYGVVYPGE